MKTNDKTVARKTGRWSVLFLAGAAALAGLGAAPSTASADRYDRDRDRDSSRFRDGRVDVRVDSGRDKFPRPRQSRDDDESGTVAMLEHWWTLNSAAACRF